MRVAGVALLEGTTVSQEKVPVLTVKFTGAEAETEIVCVGGGVPPTPAVKTS